MKILSKLNSAYYSLRYGIENLIAYTPVIWYDRDWDYVGMLDLWDKKFQRMSQLHKKYGHHIGNKRTARQLRICSLLCKRIRDDNYIDAPREVHDLKWGESEWVSLKTNHLTSEVRFVRLHVRNDQDARQEREESSRIYKHAEAQKKNDIAYMLCLVQKHLLTWWD